MRTSNNASSQIAIPSFLNTSTISTYSSRIVVVYQSYIHLLYNVKTCRAGPELAQNSHWTLLGPQPPQPARPARQGRQTRQAPALLLGPSSWASKIHHCRWKAPTPGDGVGLLFSSFFYWIILDQFQKRILRFQSRGPSWFNSAAIRQPKPQSTETVLRCPGLCTSWPR